MNNYVEIEQMPPVQDILQQAGTRISKLIGSPVMVTIKRVMYGSKEEKKIILKEIIEKEFDTPWHNIIKHDRKRTLVDARHVYMYFAKKWLHQSLSKTGYDLGHRDHTSVVHGLQKMKDMIDIKDPIIERIERIQQKLPYVN